MSEHIKPGATRTTRHVTTRTTRRACRVMTCRDVTTSGIWSNLSLLIKLKHQCAKSIPLQALSAELIYLHSQFAHL